MFVIMYTTIIVIALLIIGLVTIILDVRVYPQVNGSYHLFYSTLKGKRNIIVIKNGIWRKL